MNEPELNHDGRGVVMLLLLAFSAALYFGVIANGPPALKIGPFTIGTPDGVCHGIQQGEQPILAFCK